MFRPQTLFLSVWLLLGVACSSAGSPPASVSPQPKPVARPSPSPLVGGKSPSIDPAVHVFLWGNPSTTARDLQLARAGGFNWVKQRFEWRNIEGKARGSFEWNEPDRIVDAISRAGLRIVARVDNQPKWAGATAPWPGT